MTAEAPKVSVVVPAYNEGDHVTPVLDRIFESVRLQCEVLIVVDSEDDTTVPVVADYACKEPRLRCIVNTYGPGPANAIRFGIEAAAGPVVVVTMADGCDDPTKVDELVRLVERGVAVAAASDQNAVAKHVPHVGDGLVDRQAAVLRMRGGDDQQVGPFDDLVLGE